MKTHVSQVRILANNWAELVPENKNRRLLQIQQVDDGSGLQDVRLSFSGKNPGAVWQLDGVFAPFIAHTGPVMAYMANLEGDGVSIVVQVLEMTE